MTGPVYHGRTHAPGGTDPIALDGYIRFNATNDHGPGGALASYLYLKLLGSSPLIIGSEAYAYFLENTGVDGKIAWLQDAVGAFEWFANVGGSPYISNWGDWGGKRDADGNDLLAFRLTGNTDDHAGMLLQQTTGLTEIINNDLGIVLAGGGADINDISLKMDVGDWAFLIQNGQVVTRDPTTKAVTGIVSNELFKVRADGTTFLAGVLPQTSDPSEAGAVWNDGGTVVFSGSSAPVGLPSWFQYGSGSPVGSVTPAQTGAVYQDTTNGALYEAVGATDADWVTVGGNADYSVPGVTTASGNLTITSLGGHNTILTDTFAAAGNGNGLYWNSNDGAGAQKLQGYFGASGEFLHEWAADGSYTAPAALILPGLPTSDPSNAGEVWNYEDVVVLSGFAGFDGGSA